MIRVRTRKRFNPKPTRLNFWSWVEIGGPNDCWPWLANKRGQFWDKEAQKTLSAARVAYELANGSIEPRLDGRKQAVCHSCDNPTCCNPAHLFLGTYSDNMNDAVSKGRIRGVGSHLVAEKLLEAKPLRRGDLSVIARELGVSRERVRQIKEALGLSFSIDP